MSDVTLTGPSARQALQARMWRWLKTPWTFTILALVAVAVFDPGQLVAVADFAARAFLRTLPYILFAVLLLAFLRATGAERLVGAAFKGREYRMIILAALVGGLAPFCSCQVIPFIAGLLALGAPLSAVMAFWLASPLVDPGNTLITAAALGWDFAIADAQSRVPSGIGYKKGVPMGGDLRDAPDGKSPNFLVAAMKDPLSGNLDRIQIIKGWMDGDGNTHEKVTCPPKTDPEFKLGLW